MNRAVMEFRLRRPPFFATRFVINAFLVMLAAWWVAGGLAEQVTALPPVMVQTLVLGLAIAALSTMIVVRALRYRYPPAPIRVREDGLELPRTVGATRTFVTPWSDVHTLELRGTPERIVLLLGTKRKTFVLPSELFDRPDAPSALHAAIVEQILRQPGGGEVLDTMRRGREAMRTLVEVRPRVTHLLLLANFAAFGVQMLLGASSLEAGLRAAVQLGANVPALVHEGQIDRLVTANFLHANILHIGLNALALWMLGGLMERLLGPVRFFVVYILSCVAGAVASTYLTGGPVSLGASTGVLGVFGSLAVVHIFHLRAIPPAVRQPTRWWLVIIGINGVIGLAIPNIDHWGHAGGAAAGMVSTFLLTLGWPPLDPAPGKERSIRPFAFVLLALTIAGLSVSGYRAVFGSGAPFAALGAEALENPDADVENELNAYAWEIATDPDAVHDDLELALALANRAHEEAPDGVHIIDTVAQAHWRLGDVERAIELERLAMSRETNGELRSTYATQLARWLERRVKDDGPIVIGDDAPELSFDVRNDVLHTTMREEPPRTGLVAYVVVERGDPLPWLIEVRIAPDAMPPATHALDEQWPEGMRAHTALVDTTVEVPRGIDWQVKEYPPDDEVADLP